MPSMSQVLEEGLAGHTSDEHKLDSKASQQCEACRRLIRLWTSANRAMIVGCALQSLHLLTRRETIRSHLHWRIMMKRPIWCAQEAIRVLDTGVCSVPGEQHIGVTNVQLSAPRQDGMKSDVTFSNDSFYDHWLHRGSTEPLHSMTLYVYAMWVHVCLANDTHANPLALGSFRFDAHYVKAKNHVQVLLKEPRTPYLHGFTVPSRAKDLLTNALAHQILFRPTVCSGPDQHREQWKVALPYASCCLSPCSPTCT